jgi:hypothetical protein
MVKNKTFELKPINELFAIVKNDLRKFDNEGLIDDGNLVKTVMYCNDKLGISIREIREIGLPVNDFKAELPLDFEKLYYVCALKATGTMMTGVRNPWDNNFDQDIIYEAKLDRESLGCVDNYRVVIQKDTTPVYYNYNTWTQLDVSSAGDKYCLPNCPNRRTKGKYTIDIRDDHIDTPFKAGTLYMMYVGLMMDIDGNILFPFHPLITPYYEWCLKEKVLQDAIFNSDSPGVGELLKYAEAERAKAWIEAFNFTTEKGFGEYVEAQRKKEMKWYNQYFALFQ